MGTTLWWICTYPEGARQGGQHAALEARFLALGGDTFIDTFPEPDIRTNVPRIEHDLEVGRELDVKKPDIGRAFPKRFSR